MNTTRRVVGTRATGRAGSVLVAALVALLLSGCGASPRYEGQLAFASPEKAVVALDDAAHPWDAGRIEAILGPSAREVLSSGDPVADRHGREVFATAMDQGWTIEHAGNNKRELVIGHEQWPFPIPIVRDRHGWWFDTQLGAEEVLARRIGRNELATIGAMRAYVIAQREYAEIAHDGKPAGLYAQRIRSTPGTQDGLYWPTSASEPASPLGAFAAQAAKEGYGQRSQDATTPFRGYYYRILTAQGDDAPGGERSYLASAGMTNGFGLIAYPAEYADSGVMTFIVGPEGVVYERDLGEQTSDEASAINTFNPGPAWRIVD